MSTIDKLREAANFGNGTMDVNVVCTLLKELLINDEANWDTFAPTSAKRVRKPGKKMATLLRSIGFDLVSDSAVLEEMEYKFSVMTGYGENACWVGIIVDYWNGEVFAD